MSNNQVNESSQSVIDRAGKHHWGYNVDQVDEFLQHAHDLYEEDDPGLTQEDIQLTSFDLEKNGYVIGQVDATLIRLEKAVVDKHTNYEIAHRGRAAWDVDTSALVGTLEERAEAPDGERFKRGLPRHPSYDVKQVDLLVRQAWTRITSLLGIPSRISSERDSQNINASQVSNVIFTQRKAKHGYDESSVDAYLNRVIQVLTRIESVTRLGLSASMQSDRQFDQVGSAAAPAFEPQGSSPAPDDQDNQGGSLAGLVQHTTEQQHDEPGQQFAEPAATHQEHPATIPVPDHSYETAPSPAESVPPAAPSFAPAHKPVRTTDIPSIPPLPREDQPSPEYDSHPAPVPQSPTPSSVASQNAADATSPAAEQSSSEDRKDQKDDAYLSRLMNTNVTPTGSFDIPSLTLGSFASQHDNSRGDEHGETSTDHDATSDDQQQGQ